MRPAKDLRRLQKSVLKKIRILENYTTIAKSLTGREQDIIVSYIIIELINTWSNFNREYYISCVSHCYTTSGRLIRPLASSLSVQTAMSFMVNRTRSTPLSMWTRREEPSWHDPSVIIWGTRNVGTTNYADVDDAFSGGQTVFRHLATTRNFYAHRNSETEVKVKRFAFGFGIPGTFRPTQILLSSPAGKTSSLLEEWLEEVRFTVQYMCF